MKPLCVALAHSRLIRAVKGYNVLDPISMMNQEGLCVCSVGLCRAKASPVSAKVCWFTFLFLVDASWETAHFAGGMLVTLEGNGIPVSTFQNLTVVFPDEPQLACDIIAATATTVQCAVHLLPGWQLPDSGWQLSDSDELSSISIQLLANGKPARCGIPGGCDVTLSSAATPQIDGVLPQIALAMGNITVLLNSSGSEAPVPAVGKHSLG